MVIGTVSTYFFELLTIFQRDQNKDGENMGICHCQGYFGIKQTLLLIL